jgi:hypothetical protein
MEHGMARHSLHEQHCAAHPAGCSTQVSGHPALGGTRPRSERARVVLFTFRRKGVGIGKTMTTAVIDYSHLRARSNPWARGRWVAAETHRLLVRRLKEGVSLLGVVQGHDHRVHAAR